MSIPTSSNYPTALDTDENLYVVHDALRMTLAENYTVGDTTIHVGGDADVMANFPPSGIITLTDQCDDLDVRAISFFYGSKTAAAFHELQPFPEFTLINKYKDVTDVTLNVVASHHNNLKNAVIAVEQFVGLQGSTDKSTLQGRLNFIKKLVLTPRAWFTVDKTIGIVPLTITVTDKSFRLGPGAKWYWDFGDETVSDISMISMISTTSVVPINDVNVIVQDMNGGSLRKTYTRPNKYSIKLKVVNDYGEDTVEFEDIIQARIQAPDPAIIDYTARLGQVITGSDPPVIRSPVNTVINIGIPPGNRNDQLSNAGEWLDSHGSPIDPIIDYTWSLADDLVHPNTPTTRALFSKGGLYNLTLRADTEFGAYRITNYENSLDIVEQRNLWLWTSPSSSVARASEFGLISEVFKTDPTELDIPRDSHFLQASQNSVEATAEFNRNVAFAPRGNVDSGDSGTAMVYWASGGTPVANQSVNMSEYNGLTRTYTSHDPIPNQPWNWLFFVMGGQHYFMLGQNPHPIANTNPSFQQYNIIDPVALGVTNNHLHAGNYTGQASELTQFVSSYDVNGSPTNGRFAVYRTASKNNVGYFVRNNGVGQFFRLGSFYKTDGTLATPFQTFVKLPDVVGSAKVEGQLVALSNGIFFFDNSGNISAYNDASGVWETGSINAATFATYQDTRVEGYANPTQTFLAASDGDKTAYLSFDYSVNTFIKFSGIDNTFSKIVARPSGTQFLMGIF